MSNEAARVWGVFLTFSHAWKIMEGKPVLSTTSASLAKRL